MMDTSPTRERHLAALFIAIYIIFRMAADPILWRNISEIYSFAFEIVFISIVHWSFRNQITLWRKPNLRDLMVCTGTFLGGVVIYRGIFLVKVGLPYNLTSPQTIFMLVFFGPILEEEIFRMALWQPIEILFKQKWITIVATTALFSFGHFMAYWFVPDELKIFIVYQTVYVTGLGLVVGMRRYRTGAVLPGILMHMAFNFGFLCAFNYDGLKASF